MSNKYSIDQTTKTLVFTGKPKSLNKDSVKKNAKKMFTSVVVPNSVETIGQEGFFQCHNLTDIHIPNSVEAIGDWAFNKCFSLVSVYIPNSVASIGLSAFCYCSSLASIHIPNSVPTISGGDFGTGAFSHCSALTSVHIPNSVSTIEIWAFKECSHLHKVCVSSNVSVSVNWMASFDTETAILRPRLKPITSLQKKSACRASKATYSIYL